MRQDTGQGGAIYTFLRYRTFYPYAKFLAGLGSIEFPLSPNNPAYNHDTRTVLTPGEG